MGRGLVGFATGAVKGAVVGTAGALLNDIVYGFIPLPATMKSGAVGVLTKAGTSLALGLLSAKVIGNKLALEATQGALTVQLYNYAKPMLAGMGVPGLGYYGAGYALNQFISEVPNSLNAFVPNSLNGPDIDEDIYDSSNYPNRFVGGMGQYIQ